jgi:glutathione S-transferase
MALSEIQGPDLAGVVADATAAGLPHVVIGGFAVIAHGYPRSTKDSDLLVPDGDDSEAAIARFLDLSEARRFSDGKKLTAADIRGAHHLRVETRHGVVDIMRGGLPPLDYETVAARATVAPLRGGEVRVAALSSLVGFKRLAGRAQDRADLEALERVNGELPAEPIPGLDN